MTNFSFERVISYIKNGWEDDFLQKWQDLARKQSDAATSSMTAVKGDFPDSGPWLPLKSSKDNLPTFSMQSILSYFIERKAKDGESNKDYKNVSNKAFGLFKHGHVQKIEPTSTTGKAYIRCNCLPEMKKTMTYKVEMALSESGDIIYASCPCPAGKGPLGSCKHVAALCYALEEFARLKCTREYQSCTSRLQEWNRPRKRKLEPQSVYDIDFSRKTYGSSENNKRKVLNDPRHPSHRNTESTKANQALLENIMKVRPNCGFYYLLSDVKKDEEKKSIEIISPIKEQPVSLQTILMRAEKIKKNLMVTENERQKIFTKTKSQSNCQEWFLHRKIRITASKCKRALVRPKTSPTKAMGEILQYNQRFQSNKMRQGLEDERKILQLYEKRVGCKVKESGFVISTTHPFLGASPDGEVDGGLVEVKRIFPGILKLKEAIQKRGYAEKMAMFFPLKRGTNFTIKCNSKCFALDAHGLIWFCLI